MLNARSLKKHNAIYEIQCDASYHGFDIICITESWLTTDIDNSFIAIPGYKIFRKDRSSLNSNKTTGGGGCIFVREYIVSDRWTCHHSDQCEILWLSLSVGIKYLLVCSVYFPPDATYGRQLEMHISHSINVFRDQNPSSIVVLCGDFNNLDTDDLVLDCGLYDVCTEPTRGNNRLDKILCSDEIYFNGIEQFTSTLRTDHMGLVAYHGVEQSEKKVVYYRDHRFANKNHLNYLLDIHDLSYFLNYNDPNVLLGELSNELLNLYKVACPLKRVVLSSKDPPFMTPVIKYLLRKKHRHTRRGKLAEANAVGLQVRMLITKRAFSDSSGRNWWQRVNTLLNKNTIAPDRTCAFSAEQLNQYYNGISTASGGPFKPTYLETTNDGPQFSLLQIFNAMKRIRRTATGPEALPF